MTCPACGADNREGARFCNECAAPLVKSVVCGGCGTTSPAGRKFCDACGASLAPRPAEKTDARKVVTIVFADLIGSTGLHERLDPESVSRVMDRYHRAVRMPVEAHGGTVVQLLGDGVMCAFGVPRVAEDDALRAVRAAVAVQRAYQEFARAERGLVGAMGLRVAVNTGEVVVSDEYAAGIGDPLNVAARLQQEARDGDVLVGESTQRLVADRVTLERFGTFALRGRAESVTAYRVVSLERPAGVPATPFVGRDDELRRLMAVYETAVTERRARLAVILGSPGLGKSRLLGEVARRLGAGSTVLTARCDAAGGATFAPLAEALRAALELDDGASADAVRTAIEAVVPTDESARIVAGIASLLAGTPASPEETFFVVRRLLAALAATQPVVLAIDDLQWAEPLLLDLTEHLIQWSTGTALLVLAAARPELRDTRSAFATPGGFVSEVVTLGGLDAVAATRLAANVIGADEFPVAIAGRVLATSEGNPLFVGELVRMLVHDGVLKREGDRWTTAVALADLEMPPTIQALLAARIERLRPEERTVLERAAVVGRQFSRAAVTHLLPREIADLDARLEALRRSELIESDTGWFLGEPAMRFHHVLVRDAAYRRLLKNTRAELHARFADWLEARAGDAVEHDETIGWHLEQAHQHLRELGPIDAQGRILGERAARHLAAAGRRALARDDLPLAASLLGRALDRLDPTDPARADLTLDWCEALLAAGDVGPAAPAIDELGRFTGDSPRLRAWHTCFAGQLAALTDPQSLRTTTDTVAAAAQALADAGDAAGEAKAHSVHAIALARLGRVGACEAALDRALAAARRAHDRRRSNGVLANAPLAALWGPSPVTRASGRCLDVVRVLRITHGAPAVEAVALRCQGVLEALRGRTEAARRMLASSRRMVEELGITQRLLEADVFAGLVDLLEGDAGAAERSLRAAYDGLREHGLGIDAAQAAALLGRALLALGRADEAEALSHESEALAGDDLKAAIAWRGVRAEALARRGEHAVAIDFARAAIEIAAATDALLDHADARLALATVLRAAGRRADAAAEEARAIELWEAKGATLLVERARRDVGRVVHEEPHAARMPTPRRRVQANAATVLAARLQAAFAARDIDAVARLLTDDHVTENNPTGTVHDRDEIVALLHANMHGDASLRNEPVATLGDSLALCRVLISASGYTGATLDVAAYEQHEIVVAQVDASGGLQWAEFFAEDKLGQAVARLYERYADGLPDGPERARATATAGVVASLMRPIVGSHDAVFAPDTEFADRRRLGFGNVRGADRGLRGHRAQFEIADDIAYRCHDVLALRSDALLVRGTNSGTVRASGGAFESEFLLLSIFGTDGLVVQSEFLDDDATDEALARFDELTGAAVAPPVIAPSRVERRIRPNAITTYAARASAAIAARDFDALRALDSEQLEIVDHTTGTVLGREGSLKGLRALMRDGQPIVRYEVLATLGDGLGLLHESLTAAGFRGAELDVSSFERDIIWLLEVDAAGQSVRAEQFALDHLGDAIARLYECHAELLPEGPERDRAAATARSVAAILVSQDARSFGAALAADAEFVDRRRLRSFGASRGAERLQRAFRTQFEIADDVVFHHEDVLGLRLDAGLVRWRTSGRVRTSGGAYESRFLALITFGADGLVTRIEWFDDDDAAGALARFDELAGGTAPVAVPFRSADKRKRRVRPNGATACAARLDAAVAARNVDAIAALYREPYEVVDHTTGTEYGAQGVLEGWRALMRDGQPTERHEALATLADSLGLFHSSLSATGFRAANFDVSSFERDMIVLLEVDARGQGVRSEQFALDHLSDGIVRLYERHAELLPDGPDRARAAATARSVVTLMRPDPRSRETVFAQDIEFVDHRILGFGKASGLEWNLRGFRAQFEIADDIAHRCDDILGLRPDMLLTRRTTSGTDRTGGGRFETKALVLHAFGTDGLVVRTEWFDDDATDQALARFDELAAPAARRRRVRPNAATANTARVDAAIATRDFDALADQVAEQNECIDHPNGSVYGRDAVLASWRTLAHVPDATFRHEPLATLGDSLALSRLSLSASGVTRGRFDVGQYEREHLALTEVDAEGRTVRGEMFTADRLADAIGSLYERYAAQLPDGPERVRATTTARAVRLGLPFPDPDHYDEVVSPGFEFVDHRSMGLMGSARGIEQNLRALRSLVELTEDHTSRIDDILALQHDAFLLRITHSGRSRMGGGSFAREHITIVVFASDGLMARMESFDIDRETEAFARFAELAVPPESARRRRVMRPSAATANTARLNTAMVARDEAALATLLADPYESIDHINKITIDRRGMLAAWHALLTVPDVTYRHDPLATLGDSLAVSRASIAASGITRGAFDVGPYEQERIILLETDAHGRRRRAEELSPNRLGEALARMYERYADLLPDGPARVRAAGMARSIAALIGPVELDRQTSAIAADVIVVDNSVIGLGTSRGSESFVRAMRALLEIAADSTIRIDDVLANRDDALLVHWTNFGTGRASGGAYERPRLVIWIFDADGRVCRLEQFDADRDDDALARFAELTAPPEWTQRRPGVRPNAATAFMTRIDAAFAAHDEEGLARLVGDPYECVDHINGIVYDRQGSLATWQSIMRVPELTCGQEPLATLGDSLAVARFNVSAPGITRGDFDVGPYRNEHVFIAQTDHGQRRRAENFPCHRLGDAIARLYEWYAESLPDGPARVRAAAIARSLVTMVAPLDLDRYATVLAAELAFIDHVTLGMGSVCGAAAFLRGARSLLEGSTDSAFRIDDVLGNRPDALLVRWTNFGTDRATGGAYERARLVIWTFDAEGLLCRWEQFDPDRDNEALACFDRIAEPPPPARRVRPNTATRNAAEMNAAVATGDLDAVLALWSEQTEVIDRTTGGTTYDRHGVRVTQGSLMAARDPVVLNEALATLGDRLALFRESMRASGFKGSKFDVGAYERERTLVAEVDADGRRLRSEYFFADRLGDAVARLYERYAELQSNGPEHARADGTARSVAALLQAVDPEDALATDVVFVDHRRLGFPSVQGARAVMRGMRARLEVAENLTEHDHDVLGLRPDALLMRRTTSGTARSTGGTFERPLIFLWKFGPDGLLMRAEWFDADRAADALARFDALVGDAEQAPTPSDPRFANAVTRFNERFMRAWDTRDWDAITAPHGLPLNLDDRRRLLRMQVARNDIAAGARLLFDVPGSRFVITPIATRGTRLALSRTLFEGRVDGGGGTLAIDYLSIGEVNGDGLDIEVVLFDLDQLDAAYAELDARFTAAEAPPAAADRMSRAVATRDWAALAALFGPDFVIEDHRLLGWGTLRSGDEYVERVRTLVELRPDVTMRVNHVLAHDDRTMLVVAVWEGGESRGSFEIPVVVVARMAPSPDGRIQRWDFYDVEQLDAAHAKYREVSSQPVPRIENAATRSADRMDDAWQAHDWDRVTALFAPTYRESDRRKMALLDLSREQLLEGLRPGFDMRVSTRKRELVATRGDRLALFRMHWDLAGATVGPSEIEWLDLVEVDDHGSRIAGATFDLDDLDAAYDELDRRYGKAEAAHSRFVKWAAAHQSLAVLVEKDPLAWVLAPDFVVHDHSPLGWGTLDRSAYVESVKALAALSPDSRTRTDHVWLSDRAVLGIHVVVGTHEGGAYEQPRVTVSELDAEGRERRRDIYAPDQLDLARARFDALVARTASDPLAALARPNTATAAMDRVQAAYAARDWDAVRAACTADAPIEDRRRYVQLSGGVEGWITDLQRSVQAGSRYRRRLVSSSGERVALEVVNVTGGPPDGPWEIEFLWLIEVDDSGRITTALAFEMDDWRAARREERARWLAADATAAACLRSAVELANAFNTHDRSRVREILADDLVMDDHRRTGQGRVEGADAYVETLVDLWDLVPNIELDTAISGLPYDRHGCVTVGHYSGTLPEGGAFEIDTVAVCTVRDGLVTRLELFELDHLDDALARFAELRPAEAAKGMTG